MEAETREPPGASRPQRGGELRARYTALVEGFVGLQSELEEALKLLEAKEERWQSLLLDLDRNAVASQAKVNLNVGGRVFTTCRNTLLRWDATYFHALLGTPGNWQPCSDDGAFFIDRDPGPFEHIMSSMRSGEALDLDSFPEREASTLQVELDYYLLPRAEPPPPEPDHLRWDAGHCSSSLTVSDDGRVVTKSDGGDNWDAVLAVAPASNFKVRIRSLINGDIMVGYAKAGSFVVDQPNFTESGWFLYCHDGHLYSGFGDSSRNYCGALSQGDVLEVQLDTPLSQISFSINGVHQGVAFASVRSGNEPLFPCIEMYDLGVCMALEL